MNKALDIKNWSDRGNNYVLKGNPKNKWVGFQETVLTNLSNDFDDNFNIVIWTDLNKDFDYYCIPYKAIKHLFVDTHKTTGKYPNRWTAIILDHKFLMHSNSQLSVDITPFYAKPLTPITLVELEDDYFIENAKAEINIRIGQSKFRKGVLKNFGNKCALSGISETVLLTASHIVPWGHKKDFRGDISNGICLYVEYDKLFDEGYISFTDDLETIVIPKIEQLSFGLQERLKSLYNTQLIKPLNRPINLDYLRYHREVIFNQFKKNPLSDFYDLSNYF
ncbi:MAG: HNH endonuclease [Mucilaginibacter sp.]